MTHDPYVLLPAPLIGPSLTAAGLAAWVFASSGRDQEGRRCGELQDIIDAALTRGGHEVLVARPVLEHSAHLWEQAAEILDGQVAGSDDRRSVSESGRQAERLRLRARSLRRLLQ
jgi:hypothetical protein